MYPKLRAHMAYQIICSMRLPLVYFHLSLRYSIFPWTLEPYHLYGNVVPIFTSGEKNLSNNYRPISLLNTASKVLERLVFNRM